MEQASVRSTAGNMRRAARSRLARPAPSDIVLRVYFFFVALIMLFPMYNVIIISIADFRDVSSSPLFLFPHRLDFSTYGLLFQDATVPRAFLVSLIVTLGGTAVSMLCTTGAAYALSKKHLPGRKLLLAIILFTMYFGGGIIPLYLVIKGLGLRDSLLALILPSAVNTFYLVIMRNYFTTLPPSLEESARMDGANDLTILWRIILPISLPILATIGLFYAVDRWNEYFNALLFLSEPRLNPLQIVLRNMLVNLNMTLSSSMAVALSQRSRPVYPMSMRMAIIVITTVPILCVYPFVQRYFVSGLLLGSIKE